MTKMELPKLNNLGWFIVAIGLALLAMMMPFFWYVYIVFFGIYIIRNN